MLVPPQAEYMRLRLEQHSDRFTVAKLPPNIRKNRYSDILAYDHTRVKLQLLPNDQVLVNHLYTAS